MINIIRLIGNYYLFDTARLSGVLSSCSVAPRSLAVLLIGTTFLVETQLVLADPLHTVPAGTEVSRNNAAKLSGLIRFVDAFCTDIRPNYPRFREVIQNLGMDIEQLSIGEMLLKSSQYTSIYQKNVLKSCTRAVEQFGANGRLVPGLLIPK